MIAKQTEINGIAELIIVDNGSILLRCPEFGLMCLSRGGNTDLQEATVHIGERFTLSDADHISETYTLVGIADGVAVFEADLTFTGAGVPEEEWTRRESISVKPYNSE